MAQSLTYLLDTNIWLERLLDQDRADEVRRLLDEVSSDQLFITDFSFHSIGVILLRLGHPEAFLRFAEDLFADGAVRILALDPAHMGRIVAVASEYHLDFDDAYQYVAAEQDDVPLVSFDEDFDAPSAAESLLQRSWRPCLAKKTKNSSRPGHGLTLPGFLN